MSFFRYPLGLQYPWEVWEKVWGIPYGERHKYMTTKTDPKYLAAVDRLYEAIKPSSAWANQMHVSVEKHRNMGIPQIRESQVRKYY